MLLADDQRVVRDGLSLVLRMLPDVELVGAAEDGAQALELVGRLVPDVVLMDLRMPVLDGIEATRRIRDEHPSVRVVVLTTYADDASVFAALKAGARGYLTKDADPDEIARAIATVARGEALLDPGVQSRLLDALGSVQIVPPPPRDGDLPDGLTRREAEVLGLIAGGLSNADIAATLHVSETTVKTHVNHIFPRAWRARCDLGALPSLSRRIRT